MTYDNICQTIGGTPIVRIAKLAPPHVKLYAKLEYFNPMGSIKDRLALGVIEDAERAGKLKPGQTVIEATSGNTGIGLAMVCAQKGYPLVIVMAENFSVERRKLMRFLGARVVLTPAGEKGSGMLAKASELAQAHGWFLPRQFENEANADIHSKTTAREILADFEGQTLDYWVTGSGTGGTLKGVSRVLRAESPATKVVVCEPDNSPMLSSGIRQDRDGNGDPAASHPHFRPHLMQGWSPDFIPKLTEDAIESKWVDQIMPINGNLAVQMSKALAQKEGILTGITGGATFAGAVKIAETAAPGSTILCMLPDTGERYLSTPLFADIATDMTAEEMDISRSTPRFRFDVPSMPAPAPTKPVPAPSSIPATPEAVAFVEETVASREQPVVMFALEWCEFCWAARNMLKNLGVDYRSVDIDSVDYQKDDWGGKIRAALQDRTNFRTIPQIFVGGTFIGGSTDLLDAYNSGKLQSLLKSSNIKFREEPIDPYSFLPSWLFPRGAAAPAAKKAS
ncbi:MAG: pyridoxal-phosphate dependent enzyme [Ferrovibrio sp.]